MLPEGYVPAEGIATPVIAVEMVPAVLAEQPIVTMAAVDTGPFTVTRSDGQPLTDADAVWDGEVLIIKADGLTVSTGGATVSRPIKVEAAVTGLVLRGVALKPLAGEHALSIKGSGGEFTLECDDASLTGGSDGLTNNVGNGIDSARALRLSGSLYATGGSVAGQAGHGIRVSNGDLTVTGGSITADGGTASGAGIQAANGSISIGKATVRAAGGGLSGSVRFTEIGGTLYVKNSAGSTPAGSFNVEHSVSGAKLAYADITGGGPGNNGGAIQNANIPSDKYAAIRLVDSATFDGDDYTITGGTTSSGKWSAVTGTPKTLTLNTGDTLTILDPYDELTGYTGANPVNIKVNGNATIKDESGQASTGLRIDVPSASGADTLTLDGVQMAYAGNNSNTLAIEKAFTLRLQGSSTLKASAPHAVAVSGSSATDTPLTISGSGSLYAESTQCHGISCSGNLTVEGGAEVSGAHTGRSSQGMVGIYSSQITVRAGASLSGTTNSSDAVAAGIYCINDMAVTGGKVIGSAAEGSGVCCASRSITVASGGSITGTSKGIDADSAGVRAQNSYITANGGAITGTGRNGVLSGYSGGPHSDIMAINGGSIKGTSTGDSSSVGSGVEGELITADGAGSLIDGTSANGHGVYGGNGITVTSGGKLTGETNADVGNNYYAVRAEGSIDVTAGGYLEGTGNTRMGVYTSGGNILVDGGELKGTSNGNNGVGAEENSGRGGSITVRGGGVLTGETAESYGYTGVVCWGGAITSDGGAITGRATAPTGINTGVAVHYQNSSGGEIIAKNAGTITGTSNSTTAGYGVRARRTITADTNGKIEGTGWQNGVLAFDGSSSATYYDITAQNGGSIKGASTGTDPDYAGVSGKNIIINSGRVEGVADQTASGTYGVRAMRSLNMSGSDAGSRAVLAGSGGSHVSVGVMLQMTNQYVRFELPAGMADGATYLSTAYLDCEQTDIDVTAPAGLSLAVGGQVVLVNSSMDFSGLPATNALTLDGATYVLEGDSLTPNQLILKKTADAPQPALSASPAALGFGGITVGETSAAQSVTVSADVLSEDISFTAPQGFTVTPDADWNARTGGTLHVVFSPTQAQGYSGNLQVTSGGLTATVPLNGTGVEKPVVNGVTVSPQTATVERMGTQQFTATVDAAGGAADTVSWSVSSANSSIDASGLLQVGDRETGKTLTVTATSTADSTKCGTAVVTVTEPNHNPINPPGSTPIDLASDLTISFPGAWDNLSAILLNGNRLTMADTSATSVDLSGYPGDGGVVGKAEAGSVVVTLYKEFLNRLPDGVQTLVVEFSDGSVINSGTADFIIKRDAQPSASPSPQPTGGGTSARTGDENNLPLWIALLLAAGAGIIGTVVYRKRKARAD